MWGINRKPTPEKIRKEDQLFIDVILWKSKASIDHIISRYQKRVKAMIRCDKDRLDPKGKINPDDIFQDGITDVICQIRKAGDNFIIHVSMAAYINRSCALLCFKENKKQFNFPSGPVGDYPKDDGPSIIEKIENQIKLKQVVEFKNKLSEKCKKLIDLRFNFNQTEEEENPMKNPGFKEIANLVNLSYEAAKKKYYRCLEDLYFLIMGDNDLNEFYS